MDNSQLGLFDLADRRLRWIDRRQEVLANNVANADTPRWRPRDIAAFADTLDRASTAIGGGSLALTNPLHLAGTAQDEAGSRAIKVTEHAPDGNAVALDSELAKIGDTEAAHELVTGLYKKYLALFRAAIGH